MSRIKLKTPKEIAIIAEGGQKLKRILNKAVRLAQVGERLDYIEAQVWKEIELAGGKPAFARVPGYKWATCININEGVVHGIPNKYQLKASDVVTIDMGMFYKGWNTDTSTTFRVNDSKTSVPKNQKVSSEEIDKFLATGKRALQKAIAQARPNKRIGNISLAIQETVEKAGYTCLRNLTGHGVGRKLHEPPAIPCFIEKEIELTPLIKPGMVIAIEVIYAMGDYQTETDSDGWTIKMKDGKIAAVFEKTIAIVDDGSLICT